MDTKPVSFVITAWLEPRPAGEAGEWRYHVWHAQSGQEARFAELGAVLAFLGQAAGVAPPQVDSRERPSSAR